MNAATSDVKQVVLKEEYDTSYEPNSGDINDYCDVIGLNLEEDPDLVWIAKEGLKAPLPANWKPVKDESGSGEIYYFNFATGDSSWDHPCDAHYRSLVEKEKAKKAKTGMRLQPNYKDDEDEDEEDEEEEVDSNEFDSESLESGELGKNFAQHDIAALGFQEEEDEEDESASNGEIDIENEYSDEEPELKLGDRIVGLSPELLKPVEIEKRSPNLLIRTAESNEEERLKALPMALPPLVQKSLPTTNETRRQMEQKVSSSVAAAQSLPFSARSLAETEKRKEATKDAEDDSESAENSVTASDESMMPHPAEAQLQAVQKETTINDAEEEKGQASNEDEVIQSDSKKRIELLRLEFEEEEEKERQRMNERLHSMKQDLEDELSAELESLRKDHERRLQEARDGYEREFLSNEIKLKKELEDRMDALREEIEELRKKDVGALEETSRREMELLEAEQRDKEQKAREELRKSIEELEREMDEAKDRKKRDVDVELKEIELEKQRKAEALKEEAETHLAEVKAALELQHKESLALVDDEMAETMKRKKKDGEKALKDMNDRIATEIDDLRRDCNERRESLEKAQEEEMEKLRDEHRTRLEKFKRELSEKEDNIRRQEDVEMTKVRESQAEKLSLLQKEFAEKEETLVCERERALESIRAEGQQALQAARADLEDQKTCLEREKESLEKEIEILREAVVEEKAKLEMNAREVSKSAKTTAKAFSIAIQADRGLSKRDQDVAEREDTSEPAPCTPPNSHGSKVKPDQMSPLLLHSQAEDDLVLTDVSELSSDLSTLPSLSTEDITASTVTLTMESPWDIQGADRTRRPARRDDPLVSSLHDINQRISGVLSGLETNESTCQPKYRLPSEHLYQRSSSYSNSSRALPVGIQPSTSGMRVDDTFVPQRLRGFDDVSATMSLLESQRKWAQSVRRDLGRAGKPTLSARLSKSHRYYFS
ncbi:centrosomal protein of 164 kDa-like isoform X2 [Oscarella lobularis]|uniref:centrosomal protein of 164 kDa-like isoform X2 n=1 Tax=Oscarella lobularis TaxID=121494 RepID=UPI0033137675